MGMKSLAGGWMRKMGAKKGREVASAHKAPQDMGRTPTIRHPWRSEDWEGHHSVPTNSVTKPLLWSNKPTTSTHNCHLPGLAPCHPVVLSSCRPAVLPPAPRGKLHPIVNGFSFLFFLVVDDRKNADSCFGSKSVPPPTPHVDPLISIQKKKNESWSGGGKWEKKKHATFAPDWPTMALLGAHNEALQLYYNPKSRYVVLAGRPGHCRPVPWSGGF